MSFWLPLAQATAPHVLTPYALDKTRMSFPCIIAVKPYKVQSGCCESVFLCTCFEPYFVLGEPSNT